MTLNEKHGDKRNLISTYLHSSKRRVCISAKRFRPRARYSTSGERRKKDEINQLYNSRQQ